MARYSAKRIRSSSGEGGSTSMLLTTRSTPSIFFTTFSASDLSVGRVTCPYNSTVLPFTRYARLSKRSEEHTSELQSRQYLVCRLLLEKKKTEQHAELIGEERARIISENDAEMNIRHLGDSVFAVPSVCGVRTALSISHPEQQLASS